MATSKTMSVNDSGNTADKAKILLIEDDERMIEIITGRLAEMADVTVARSAASAYACRDDYRLVVCDLSIPSQDGSLDAEVSHGAAVLAGVALDDATRGATVFVFSGYVDAAPIVAQINNRTGTAARLFSKSELPEMLKAAEETCS